MTARSCPLEVMSSKDNRVAIRTCINLPPWKRSLHPHIKFYTAVWRVDHVCDHWHKKMILVGFSLFSLSIGAAKVFRSVMSAGAKKVLLTIDEVGPMGTGDTIYERSHYCFYKEDGSVFDQGKYVQNIPKICISVWELPTINHCNLL